MPNLNRFHIAQQRKTSGYAQARQEMSDGKKTGHWIWYILQLNIFGFSSSSQTYGIAEVYFKVCKPVFLYIVCAILSHIS